MKVMTILLKHQLNISESEDGNYVMECKKLCGYCPRYSCHVVNGIML